MIRTGNDSARDFDVVCASEATVPCGGGTTLLLRLSSAIALVTASEGEDDPYTLSIFRRVDSEGVRLVLDEFPSEPPPRMR